MNPQLKIAVWNANGLVNHGPELKSFLGEHDIDIMLISESHFTNRSYLRIHNYTIYNTKHPNNAGWGGSALIIKNKLKHHEMPEYHTEHIQATTILVEDMRGPLAISAIYSPPKHAIKEEQYKEYFATLGNRFLAGGDYNAKHSRWGSRLTTTKGRELVKVMDKQNLGVLSTGKPTYWPSDTEKIPDVIDFCVTKGIPSDHLQAEQSFDLSSDHSPILILLSSTVINKQKPASLTNKWTDWELFKSTLQEKIDINVKLKTPQEIDTAVEELIKTIQQASWVATPEVSANVKIQNQSNLVKEAIQNKRRLRRIWMTTRAPQHKEKLNRAEKNLKKLLKDEQNRVFQEYLEGLTPTEATEYSLWKATAKLNKAKTNIPPIKNSDSSWARTDKEKAAAFAKHLENVFRPFPAMISQEEDNKIIEFLQAPYQMAPPIQAIKLQEIKTLIKNINSKKAPGYDLITGSVIKQLPDKALTALNQIYNSILRTGHYPSQWKVGQIILIPKAGKPPEEVTSYRPISLLPILSKLFEKLFLKRLKPEVDKLKIIPEHQFGFREQHATIEQVHRVVEVINNAFERKKYCSAAFLDVTQAFDKVWHQGLLYKIKTKLPTPYYQVLKSYLTDRYFMIKHQEETTELHKIQAGVPQGSVLGPFLYLIYTADIPTTPNTITATFADDTAILATSEIPAYASEKLQEALDQIQEWFKKWRIKANEAKSQHITFSLRKETCPSVTLNGEQLPHADNAKYLGMHLDRRLNWKKHIFTKRKQLGLKLSKLYWLIGRKSKLSLESKLTVYKVIIKPVWTYGIQLWGTASASNMEILQRFQSKTLRTITNAPWFVTNKSLHHDLNIPLVRQEAKCASERYLSRLVLHPNSLAGDLLTNKDIVKRLKRLNPLNISHR